MLLYTVIQSRGYFIARRELGAVVMFAVLIALTIGAFVILLAP
jgi:Na+/proline symporter